MSMIVYNSTNSIQKEIYRLIQLNKSIAFVPTMGFLHDGHIELVKAARKKADIVVVSIFVNTKQFSKNEDLSTYPSDIDSDKKKLEAEDVDFLFQPSVQEMYPEPFLTHIEIEELTNFLCGKSRPGHFNGVAIVVAKLLNILMPDFVFFGQKDYQQCLVIKQLMKDLNYRTEMIICPIIREKSGLALSSRNSYLSDTEKEKAAEIYKSLKLLEDKILEDNLSIERLKQIFMSKMNAIEAKIDYLEFTDMNSLKAQEKIERPLIIATAVFIGKTRLIDNIMIN